MVGEHHHVCRGPEYNPCSQLYQATAFQDACSGQVLVRPFVWKVLRTLQYLWLGIRQRTTDEKRP